MFHVYEHQIQIPYFIIFSFPRNIFEDIHFSDILSVASQSSDVNIMLAVFLLTSGVGEGRLSQAEDQEGGRGRQSEAIPVQRLELTTAAKLTAVQSSGQASEEGEWQPRSTQHPPPPQCHQSIQSLENISLVSQTSDNSVFCVTRQTRSRDFTFCDIDKV